MKNSINIEEPLEPNIEESCIFASKEKLAEHVEKHLVLESRLRHWQFKKDSEDWWDLLGKYEEWKEYNRQKGKDLINAVRHGTKKESDEAFWILCDLYERFAEEELKNACLIRRTDHYHRLALSENKRPIGQIIELFSPKNFFIAADLRMFVSNESFLRYALCTCYRTEPSMKVDEGFVMRRQRNRERNFRSENHDRWYATSELIANHNPEEIK